MTQVWKDFLDIARQELGSRVVDTWLKVVHFFHWDKVERIMYVEVPNSFTRDWIKTKYTTVFTTTLARLLHVNEVKVIFLIPSEKRNSNAVVVQTSAPVIKSTGTKKHTAVSIEPNRGMRLSPECTFETFVVGSHNNLAYSAARAIVQEPGFHYNPFFIYGGSGLGKTHLLHAIGNAIREKDPKIMVMYQTTDRFVNEFIAAIRFNKIFAFQQKYRSLDVLLIDDIQFISNKEQTQEAFFHIFNVLYEKKKQIVFSSDLFPRQIMGLEERLRSRLEGGLIADISQPLLETKIAIVKKKALSHNEILSDEIATCIAQNVVSNIRELEGLLVRVIAFASLTKQSITVDLVRKIFAQSSHTKHITAQEEKVDFDLIVHHVCKFYSYKISDLRSESRAKELALVRQVAMYLMKQLTNKSLQEIGAFLGRKNHSTVIHAFDRVDDALKCNHELRSSIEKIKKGILSLRLQ